MELPASILPLPPGEIHLWYSFQDEIRDSTVLSLYEQMLSPDEKERWKRFYFKEHQHQYLVTRALVRTTLSLYHSINPCTWRFSKSRHGKPEIIPSAGMEPIRFNISHTSGLILCGVVRNEDIGVDVEDIKSNTFSIDIANKCFSSEELKDLYATPERERRSRFLEYWTLKESFVKARGVGLSLPLKNYSFRLLEKAHINISFNSNEKKDFGHWQFWLIKPSENHISAVAIRKNTLLDYHLSVRKIVPLLGMQPLNQID